MKLLMENWRRFLAEAISDVQQHNIDFYKKEVVDYPYLNPNLASVFNEVEPSKVILGIKPLAKNKITKFIDAGAFGVVLGLDNGHVLKLYVSGIGDIGSSDDPSQMGKAEEKFYKKSMEDLYSGEATRTTLPVYDMGTINLTDDGGAKKRVLRYVEMARLEPIDNSEKTMKDAVRLYLPKIKDMISDQTEYFASDEGLDLDSADLVGVRKEMKDYLIEHGVSSEEVAERIVDSLFSSIEEMIRKHGIASIEDLSSRNLAIDPTSPMDDPKFILFDP